MSFFNLDKINDLDELKAEYFKLAKKYHPDVEGGNTAKFQELQNEYESLTDSWLKNKKFTKSEATNEIKLDQQYTEVINQLANIEGIKVEIIGTWIWVSGNTFPIKEVLKSMKFVFAPVKKMWYINTTGEKIRSKGDQTIEQIRNKYGSMDIKGRGSRNLSGLGSLQSKKLKDTFKKLISLVKKRKSYLKKTC